MNSLRLLAGLGLAAAALAARAEEREQNVWPLSVSRRAAADAPETWGAAGPLLFSHPAAGGGMTSGFRPLWVQTVDARGDYRSATFLYPLFSYTADDEIYSWSLFQLINRKGRRVEAANGGSLLGTPETFDLWPFWFSRTSGDPEMRYRGLFPIAGTVRGRLGFLGYERLTWGLFPLYLEAEKRGAVTTSTPWPFVRVTRGAATGFSLWPLFGWQERPGEARSAFYLWPLGYDNVRLPSPDDPKGTPPTRQYGALPFYAQASGPGYLSEDFLWPFFGHTERTAPKAYRETRWLWPLLVQGRGDERYVNRWAPLYTHSIVKGYDKTWVAWPLWREARWTADGVAQTKTQLLWVLYWSLEQRSTKNPRAEPATLTHVWPLFTAWDNGAGRKQFQLLSPLPVFFPQIEKVNETWSPLFAVFRYDERGPGEVRASLLWDGVTWEQRARGAETEFHLGPLLSVTADAREQRVAFGNGLFGMRRAPGERAWRGFLFDFSPKPAIENPSARSP